MIFKVVQLLCKVFKLWKTVVHGLRLLVASICLIEDVYLFLAAMKIIKKW
jgi:hypothetical protein